MDTLNDRTTLTVSEAASLLGCTPRTIRYMIQRGSLSAWKIDPYSNRSDYRVTRESVDRLIRRRQESIPLSPN